MARPPALRPRLLAALALWLVLSVVAVVVLASVQRSGRAAVDERFEQRAVVSGRFVATYVDEIMNREAEQGRQFLSGRVSDAGFDRIVQADRFGAAVLLDERGRLLRVFPRKPSLLGTVMTGKYAHLRAAVAGKPTISQVVPSAARGEPIVAFAVPFDTPHGRRVYSGAQAIGSTTAGAYLRNSLTMPSARLYLLDPAGVVIAGSGPPLLRLTTLADVEPALARGLARAGNGTVAVDGTDQRYASAAILGTPWRVVVAVPSTVLYRSTGGVVRWLPWLVLAGFVLASLIAILLVARVIEARRHLVELNARLEEAVRVDPLTGLFNRRGLDEHLSRAVSAARRHDHPLTLMLLDVDHFKRLNDTHGHLAGDVVLCELADVVGGLLRAEDVVGRWGGEEFLIVLPDTDGDAALALGERLRERVAAQTFRGELRMTVSIGVGPTVDDADRALYAAKDAGRDRVCGVSPAAV